MTDLAVLVGVFMIGLLLGMIFVMVLTMLVDRAASR